jgi:hypothetical protein
MKKYTWARKHPEGYEMSSRGNKAFSAFYATMPDGKSIEHHYQVNVKGYPSIKEGKGKPPLNDVNLWEEYLKLWKTWAENNQELITAAHEYFQADNIRVFTDMFATTEVNQAHALSVIFNEKFYELRT